jgi:hypothetical protein
MQTHVPPSLSRDRSARRWVEPKPDLGAVFCVGSGYDGRNHCPEPETVRHHHVKAALYSAIGSIESFLNTTLYGDLKAQGVDAEAIREQIRKPSFAVKVKKWPTELAGTKVVTSDETLAAIFAWQKLRDEVTHPKIDHSLYDELAAVKLDPIRPTIAEFIVRVLQARNEIYPYWLLGWNFITGPEHDEPKLISNQQFIFGLGDLGFDVPGPAAHEMEHWESAFMTSVNGYRALDQAFQSIDRCEPRDARFRFAPRLCRKWWDPVHTSVCG